MKNPFLKFRHRSKEDEIMDNLNCHGEVLATTLKELDYINMYLGGNAMLLKSIEKVFSEFKGEILSIADLGCGSGTLLILISRLAETKGIKVKLHGVDANKFIIEYAKKNAALYPQIEFVQINVFENELLNQSFDVIICSLFCHHIENVMLETILKRFYATTKMAIIVSDLHRHWVAYYSIKLLTAIFSSSTMVKYDAGLSVLKAFKRNELVELLHRAGIEKYTLKWKWAFRYELMIDCRK